MTAQKAYQAYGLAMLNGHDWPFELLPERAAQAWADVAAACRPCDESDRQLIVLALAILSLRRPGFEYACRQAATKFEAESMFDSFRRSNRDVQPPEAIPTAAGLFDEQEGE